MAVTEDKLLTEETVGEYIEQNAVGTGIVTYGSKWTGKAITGGNVNYAFCVTEEGTDNKLFVKQAPEFVAIYGPDGLPLTSNRMLVEVGAYNEWGDILGTELTEKYLPNIIMMQNSAMIFVMKFLDGYTLLDHELVGDTIVSKDIAKGLADFMAKIHARSHSINISKERKDSSYDFFENRAMRDIQLEYVFTKCYTETTDEQREGLNMDEAFMKEIEDLKAVYNGANKDNVTLCHGDLHPGSIMIKEDDVKVIDPEFAVYASPGLDVGTLLSGYVLGAVHQTFSDNKEAVDSIIEAIETIWSSYSEVMKAEKITDELMATIESDTVGFALAEVCRTALEFAGGRKWLQFEDANVKAKAKKAALTIVQKCMTKRHENGMELLLSTLKEVTVAGSGCVIS